MLSVSPLAKGGATYYLAQTNYYDPAQGEPPGIWHGHGALEFGLSGIVKAEHLERMCEGFEPHQGLIGLTQNAGLETRKHGDDLTFSVPKSASVAYALGPEWLQTAIHEEAMAAAKESLDYLEARAGYARLGRGGQVLVPAPLTFALFFQSTTRMGDPGLHIHSVCPNATMHPDGHTTAIDSTHFYYEKMAAGALFRASLSQRLENLGFEIERDGTSFKLSGIPEPLCERFSQRRAEIKDRIEELAGSLDAGTARMAELVTLETRRAKHDVPREEQRLEWRKVGEEFGITQREIQGLLKQSRQLSPEEKQRELDAAYKEAVGEQLSNQFSHWAERDAVRAIAVASQGRGLNGRDVLELVETKIANRDMIHLGELVTEKKSNHQRAYRDRSEERYSTPEILSMERDLLLRVERMSQVNHPVRDFVVEGVLASRPHLSDEQKDAVRHLTTAPGLIHCMSGKAGTGKSTTLDACRMAFELEGKELFGCAIAGIAAEELRTTARIKNTDTVAMTLLRLERNEIQLSGNSVLVVDEAGMVPTKTMREIVRHTERADATLLLVGDAKQFRASAGQGVPSRASRSGSASAASKISDVRTKNGGGNPWPSSHGAKPTSP